MLTDGRERETVMTRRPVRCVACRVTFLRPEYYMAPTHACVRESLRKHPSSREGR